MLQQKEIEDFFLEQLFKDYDEVIESVLYNSTSNFNNKEERNGFYFKAVNKVLGEWAKSQNCIYRNCKNKSIKRSHTITKSAFLSRIADNGHVYTPAPDYKTGLPQIKKVGISNASTFPGFCLNHEKLFFEFESKKVFDGNPDIIKQIYRTICREVVIKELRLKTIEHIYSEYKKFKDEKILIELRKRPIIKLIEQKATIVNLKFEENDSVTKSLKSEISSIRKDIKEFKNFFYDKIHDELELKCVEEYFWGVNIFIEEQLPVALAGRGNFKASMHLNAKEKKVELILNVLPTKNGTSIFIFCLKEDEEYVKQYLNHFIKQDFGLINMVETWMIHGTDHWFLKPSVWEAITIENKKQILVTIKDLRNNIISNYGKTIFNKFKRDRLTILENLKTKEDFEKFVSSENGKFTDCN